MYLKDFKVAKDFKDIKVGEGGVAVWRCGCVARGGEGEVWWWEFGLVGPGGGVGGYFGVGGAMVGWVFA